MAVRSPAGLTPKEELELEEAQLRLLELEKEKAQAFGVEGGTPGTSGAAPPSSAETAFGGQQVENEPVPEVTGPKGLYVRTGLLNVPKPSMAFAKQAYPKYDWEISSSNNIVAKDPETGKTYRLDPSSLELYDVTDVLPDIATGVVEGTATAGGAALGGLPGAMAAGGAAATGTDLLRQGLGNLTGAQEGYDPGSTVESAIAGTTMPVVFGGGMTMDQAKNLARRKALEGASQAEVEAAARKIYEQQRGIPGKTYDYVANKVAPKVGQFLSQNKAEVLQRAANMLDTIEKAKTNPKLRNAHIDDAQQKVSQGIKAKLQELGNIQNEFKAKFDAATSISPEPGVVLPGKVFKLNDYLTPFDDVIRKYGYLQNGSDEDKAIFKNMVEKLNHEIYTKPHSYGAEEIHNLKSEFNQKAIKLGADYSNASTPQSIREGIGSAVARDISAAYTNAANQIKQDMEMKFSSVLGPNDGINFANSIEAYANAKKLASEIQKNFKSPEKTKAFLGKLLSPGGNIEREKAFRISNLLENPEEVSNMFNKDVPDAEAAKEIMDKFGVDLTDAAITEKAFETFTDPSAWPKSTAGTTSTSRTAVAGTVGAMIGRSLAPEADPWTKWIATALGAVGGNYAVSDKGMLNAMKANRLLRETIPQSSVYYPQVLRPEIMQMLDIMYQGKKPEEGQ